ncbi:NAD-dependent epimerase/dehydratase family protein [Pseudenhygromyxa sp. WMMC2535]|uniref:NAD-dependent epimerase/dehydratase family protein n=1 Tax=Pseudenhygromyxa sp. WMMC2535 TaxID=2712867 RepID=UPI0015574A3C|nr:NAD-dependent epimerase/dehydratase family protein [Pseudenhygromyxa sp. WMMC2535]NVB37904.1 NAD-dependent epimerase/dehydratase family protein [Pseudenhygromyxa sp. WMMC2535]
MSEASSSLLRPGQRRVLVAGAHRKIAIALIERLLADARVDKVLAVAEGPCPATLLAHDPERFIFTQAALARRRAVDNLFLLEPFRDTPVDTVLHLAFSGNPKGYDVSRHEYNVNATRHLLDASLRHGVGKYVFLSSDAVYAVGPRGDYQVGEDAELNLDPQAPSTVRDIIDAEFLCRAKMDHPACEVMVLRPAGVIGGGVMSGLNLLFESSPPVLPIGFDPMINPTSKERLARDLQLALMLRGKGVYNVAGPDSGPLSRFLEARGITAMRVPGPMLRGANRFQRMIGHTRYHAEYQPKRLFYSLVLDDARFEAAFRAHADEV